MADRFTWARKKPKKRTFVVIAAILAIIVIIIIILRALNSPAVGTITKAGEQKGQSSVLPPQTPNSYSDNYITLSDLDGFKKVDTPPSPGLLSSVNFISTDGSSEHLAVTVIRESLDSDSGLNYRKQHPELYKLQTASSDQTVYISTANGAEQTGFYVHNGLVAALSLTVPSAKDLSADFNTIAGGLSWK